MNRIWDTFLFLYFCAFAYFFHITGEIRIALTLLAFGSIVAFFTKTKKDWPLFAILLTTSSLLAACRFSPIMTWPLDYYGAALIGWLIWKKGFPSQSSPLNWSFRFSKKEWLSVFVINIPAIFILILYFQSHMNVARMWPFPTVPLWATPLLILGIAAINGLREEIYYRGLLQEVTRKTHSPLFTILLQALLFGTLHFTNGFPQGWIGVGLTALWGAAIAIQYQMFRSIALAWLTHAMADAIMFTIILIYR